MCPCPVLYTAHSLESHQLTPSPRLYSLSPVFSLWFSSQIMIQSYYCAWIRERAPCCVSGGHSLRALPLLQGFVRLFEPTGEDVAHPMDAEPFIVSYPSQALEVEGFSARRNGLVLSPLHCEALAPAPSVKQGPFSYVCNLCLRPLLCL